MTEQAAPATRKYVILESKRSPDAGVVDPLGTLEELEIWAHGGVVSAVTREKALEKYAEQYPDWAGGTLVAIPEGSWVPTPVRVETKRNVTLG